MVSQIIFKRFETDVDQTVSIVSNQTTVNIIMPPDLHRLYEMTCGVSLCPSVCRVPELDNGKT